MAIYRCVDTEAWLPKWAQGKGLSVSAVRLHAQDGAKVEISLDAYGNTPEITDERCLRHLDADPRFTKL